MKSFKSFVVEAMDREYRTKLDEECGCEHEEEEKEESKKVKRRPMGGSAAKPGPDNNYVKPMGEAVSEKDDEYSMIRSQLKSIHNAASRLDKKVGKNKKGGMEAWVQSKITKAQDYIDTAADYVTNEEAGEKDACYKKVKSRYSVWPSAYASGALVKCRKVGAANWGNKKKK